MTLTLTNWRMNNCRFNVGSTLFIAIFSKRSFHSEGINTWNWFLCIEACFLKSNRDWGRDLRLICQQSIKSIIPYDANLQDCIACLLPELLSCLYEGPCTDEPFYRFFSHIGKGDILLWKGCKAREGENLLFLAFVTLHKKTFRASVKYRERVADSLRFWSVMSPRLPPDQAELLSH